MKLHKNNFKEEDKKQRLTEALRENLKKRKEQQRVKREIELEKNDIKKHED